MPAIQLVRESLAWWPRSGDIILTTCSARCLDDRTPSCSTRLRLGGGMADYHFVSTWRIQAPIEQVWEEIVHAERWPTWWKYVVRVDTMQSGGVEGSGRCLLTPEDGGTLVRYNWDVRTTSWWMNLLAPIARPAFNWNHDQLMLEGGRSLARRFGVGLELPDEERQPAGAARWAAAAAAVAVLILLGWRRRTAARWNRPDLWGSGRAGEGAPHNRQKASFGLRPVLAARPDRGPPG